MHSYLWRVLTLFKIAATLLTPPTIAYKTLCAQYVNVR